MISDTHGLLRSEVFDVFRGVDLILHAGDIGGPEGLKGLRSIAPVIAVRGNNDKGAWADRIPETKAKRVSDVRVFLIHDLKDLDLGSLCAISGNCNRAFSSSISRQEK